MATKTITFPDAFPDSVTLRYNIQDTVTYSWALQNFTEYNISAWLNNFQGEVFPKEDEERIALWLLSNYTHYNEKEVDHLCKTLYKKFIHTYVTDQRLTEETLLESMKDFCYIPLGSASESGGFIAYQFRKQAKIGIDRFFFPTENTSINGNVAIFIDDVTLSATQAKDPITDFVKNHSFDSVYLLTLISSSQAEKELLQNGIKTISCIEIDEKNQCFSGRSILFHKFPDLLEPVKDFCAHYGSKVYRNYPLGYKDGQYLFGFFYNTPNNTLPIFWSNKNGWIPIFERKEKIRTDARIWRTFEKYI